ncbi:MAG: ribonuclease E/G [Proteobacteria bacterium]|nr:ribonuclease E/G [Pseudomonadota bacterium]
MPKRMLIDANHPEQTRVAVVDGRRLDEFDFETVSRKQLKGNIYLAKVVRIEPSLQAAFVEYGGNRHGFLAFSEIHADYYRIPVADRQALEEAMAEERAAAAAAQEGQPYTPYQEEAAPAEEDANVPFVDEEVQETGIAQSALPPAIGLGVPESGLMIEPFALEGEEPLAEEGEPMGEEPTGAEFSPEQAAEPAMEGAIPVESVGGDETEAHREQRRRRFIRRYRIQEVIKRGQIMLIQVVKEERGNKGAALTTYLSLAGRYCVLMPNTGKGGGISRKITNMQDRRRMRELLDELEVPDGMAVILRTAGMERGTIEVRRDLEYLLRLWDSIREMTLKSIAPCLIYEEANLIKRAIRDLYAPNIEAILVEGEEGFTRARDFMRMLMPNHLARVHHYNDGVIPLFFRYQVENQINALHSPVVRLRSGGYIVINQAEALVAIDVNSGRATRERNIEETAYRTNMEAAEEIARQLRLRDLAGLIVIDFIDMEDGRNNSAVERRLKEAMRHDRARLQIGRISHFGLLELSRQRLRPSLIELNFEKCPHCHGTGHIRTVESTALLALHALEEEGIRQSASEVVIGIPGNAAQYILNNKREALNSIEKRYGMSVRIRNQEDVVPPDFPIERIRGKKAEEQVPINLSINEEQLFAEADRKVGLAPEEQGEAMEGDESLAESGLPTIGGPSRELDEEGLPGEAMGNTFGGDNFGPPGEGEDGARRRRRGRRGGRRRGGGERGGGDSGGGGGRFRDNYAPHDNYAPRENYTPGDYERSANFNEPGAAGEQNPGNEFTPRPDLPSQDDFQPRDNFRQGGDYQQRGDRGPRRGGRGRFRDRDRDRGGDRNRNRGDRNFDRPPRDPNREPYRDRPPRDYAPPQQAYVPPPVAPDVALDIFELDTTPKDKNYNPPPRPPMPQAPPPQARSQERQEQRQERAAPPPRAPEPAYRPPEPPPPVSVADQGLDAPPDKKKSGWWSKFTGA